MKCNSCGTQMRPLFNSSFCPNDCDRKTEPAKQNGRNYFVQNGVTWSVERVPIDSLPPPHAEYEYYLNRQQQSMSTEHILEKIMTYGDLVTRMFLVSHMTSSHERIVFWHE